MRHKILNLRPYILEPLLSWYELKEEQQVASLARSENTKLQDSQGNKDVCVSQQAVPRISFALNSKSVESIQLINNSLSRLLVVSFYQRHDCRIHVEVASTILYFKDNHQTHETTQDGRHI
jgi:hypothetical protein